MRWLVVPHASHRCVPQSAPQHLEQPIGGEVAAVLSKREFQSPAAVAELSESLGLNHVPGVQRHPRERHPRRV